MIYQKDWFMRQIQLMIQGIARVFFGKDTIEYRIANPQDLTESDLLFRKLLALLSEKRVNEAEDLLFEQMRPGDLNHLAIAVSFYERLSAWGDQELAACGFSMEEVKQGLQEVCARFGVPVETNPTV